MSSSSALCCDLRHGVDSISEAIVYFSEIINMDIIPETHTHESYHDPGIDRELKYSQSKPFV